MADMKLTPDLRRRLTAYYQQTDAEITALIEKALEKRRAVGWLEDYQRRAQQIVAELNAESGAWVNTAVPRSYSDGVNQANAMARQAHLPVEAGFFNIPQWAVKDLCDEATVPFNAATSRLGRQVDDVFRELQMAAVRGSVTGYQTYDDAAKRLLAELDKKQIVSFRDKAGRNWRLETYAEMAGQTVTMEAHLLGTGDRLLELGQDLVRISAHSNPCELCIPWEDKVLSLTGATPGYPTMAEARAAGLFHPRCEHAYGAEIVIPTAAEAAAIETQAKQATRRPSKVAQITPSAPTRPNAKPFSVAADGLDALGFKQRLEIGDYLLNPTRIGIGKDAEAKAKKAVMKDLGKRLRKDEDFQALAARFESQRGMFSEDGIDNTVATLVRNWASTSGDSDELAVALQLAAKQEFGLGGSSIWFDAETVAGAQKQWGDVEAGLRAFLRAMHDNTQEWFRSQDITSVTLVRGMNFKTPIPEIDWDRGRYTGRVGMQPLNSWSSDQYTAVSFANRGNAHVVTGAEIPVERIIGTPRTGLGCLGEQEFVVLAPTEGADEAWVVAWTQNEANPGGYGITKALTEAAKAGR